MLLTPRRAAAVGLALVGLGALRGCASRDLAPAPAAASGSAGAAGRWGAGAAGAAAWAGTAGAAGTWGAGAPAVAGAGSTVQPPEPTCSTPTPKNMPAGWVTQNLGPCVAYAEPGPAGEPFPAGTWEPCPPYASLKGFEDACRMFVHPWAPPKVGVRTSLVQRGADGQVRLGVSIPGKVWSNPYNDVIVSGVFTADGTPLRVVATSYVTGGWLVVDDRFARWDTTHEEGSPNAWNTWFGATVAGGPYVHDAIYTGDGPFSVSWWGSRSYIVAYKSQGVWVSPWKPGDWTQIYAKAGPGPLSTFAAAAGDAVFIARGHGPSRVDVWTAGSELKPLIDYPTDVEREVDLFGASASDLVWTFREGPLSPYVKAPNGAEQTHEVNDVYTAPFTTSATELQKTKRRLRKDLVSFADYSRWVVGEGYAAIGTVPDGSLVRLSDGAAWYFPTVEGGGPTVVTGIVDGFLYVNWFQTGDGGHGFLARFEIAKLPAPVPAD